VGVLSTGLLHEQLVRKAPPRQAPGPFLTVVDRLPAHTADAALAERAPPGALP
jgi:hypothetical protein